MNHHHIVTTGTLEPTYRQLQTMKLDKSPFVIISVIGQELLAQVIKISKHQNKYQKIKTNIKIKDNRKISLMRVSI